MHLLVDIVYGAIVGIVLGMTGGGGSIVTLPLLVYAVGEDVHTAIGTSLAVVGGIATQGFISQRQRVDWQAGLVLGAIGIIGSIPGSLLAAHVSGNVLLLLFAGVMIVAAIAMIRRRVSDEDGERKHAWGPLVVAGIALGFLTGFLGVGGGFLIVPTMVFALGFTMREAIPTSLLIIALNSFVALATRASSSTSHGRPSGSSSSVGSSETSPERLSRGTSISDASSRSSRSSSSLSASSPAGAPSASSRSRSTSVGRQAD